MPKRKSSQSPTLSNEQLVAGVLSLLEKNRFRIETIRFYRRFYARFFRFLKEHGKTAINHGNIDAFLRHLGVAPNGSSGDIPYHYTMRAVLRRLIEFKQTGSFPLRKSQSPPIPVCFEGFFDSFLKTQKEKRAITMSSLKQLTYTLRLFLDFLHKKRVKSMGDAKPEHVKEYVQERQGKYGVRSALHAVSHLKILLRLMMVQGIVSSDFLEAIPKIPDIRRKRLPNIWPSEAIQKLLNVIDRDSPLGKRDYAVCLLIVRYGIRIGDICSLKYENIDWERGVISIVMQKTRKGIEFPLSEEVGLALIDYLKNGRPKISDNRFVFLQHKAPYGPLNRGYNIIHRHRIVAGIILDSGGSTGPHSLRFTLATRLHESNTPFSAIAAVLGHSSIESTRVYAKANVAMLRKLALDCEEVSNG